MTVASNKCYGHLFYFDPKNEPNLQNVTYMSSFHSPWSEMTAFIKAKLTESNLGTYGISVGFLGQDGAFPKLKPLVQDFESLQSAKKAMIVIVSSFKYCQILVMRFEEFY